MKSLAAVFSTLLIALCSGCVAVPALVPHAAALSAIFITLCGGCASAPVIAPTPVILRPAFCPQPSPPPLPQLGGLAFLESREAYAVLKMRDDTFRAYIKGLESALTCYKAQTEQTGDKNEPR